MKRNFSNTLQYFSRFLGLNTDCEQLSEEMKFVTFQIEQLKNKKFAIKVVSRGVEQKLSPEQVMAGYFRLIKRFFESFMLHSNNMVISIPSYTQNSERQAYLDAAKIAGLNCLKLISESTAIGLCYGF
mmetsp:Transcript_18144/g.31006  ORF Transcript_18144/g.31006 Transcript_18144/m.31006 type:complete len:128 (+) Transcript_18144:214-597(+)